MAPTAAVEPVFPACSAPTGKKREEFVSKEPGGRAAALREPRAGEVTENDIARCAQAQV